MRCRGGRGCWVSSGHCWEVHGVGVAGGCVSLRLRATSFYAGSRCAVQQRREHA